MPQLFKQKCHHGNSAETVPQLSKQPIFTSEVEKGVEMCPPKLSTRDPTPVDDCCEIKPRHKAQCNSGCASMDLAESCVRATGLKNETLTVAERHDCAPTAATHPPNETLPTQSAVYETHSSHQLTKDDISSSPQAANDNPSSLQPMVDSISSSSPVTTDDVPPPLQTTNQNPSNTESQQNIASMHIKPIANDCFVDLSCNLPADNAHQWHTMIEQRLYDIVYHSLPDVNFTIECVMAQRTVTSSAEPTVLLMCSESAHKKKLQKTLRKCKFISPQFRRKVAMLDINLCASGNSSDLTSIVHDEELSVETIIGKPSLFASLVKIYSVKDANSTVFSTIGGVISINGAWYGLTTAHAFRRSDIAPQKMPEISGTIHEHVVSSSLAHYFKVSP